ncbi:thiamine-binding protein [Streptomyces sp. NPDC057242]|uniref:thiamine-binding protein n=1 Tax=Streptomyces sp. NPDC057242 TaxID=3346063 RepID=UPI00362641C4
MIVAFSVTPLGVGEEVGEYVADAVRVVRESGLPNRTDAMFTSIEGEWDEVMDVVKPYGLTFARYEALVLLTFSKAGELPMSKIGERLMVHPTSVTNTVDRLVRSGLVAKRPNPNDGRGTLATITDRGREVVEAATRDLMEMDFGLGAYDAEECAEIFAMLRPLRVSANDFDEA